jgi:translation initiation factor 1A
MTEEVIRVKLPKRNEVLGEIEEILGASRLKVMCKDENKRICRIPGKFRKRINLRVGDLVIIKPWDVQSEERGDVVWIYNKTQATWLRRNGYI